MTCLGELASVYSTGIVVYTDIRQTALWIGQAVLTKRYVLW